MARPTLASTLPGIIALIAFILSLFAVLYCKFLSFTSEGTNPITLYFGIWSYQGWTILQSSVQGTVILEACYGYPEDANVDSQWRAARAFGTLALILGGVAAFYSLLAFCMSTGKNTFEVGAGIYVLICLFQGLSLLVLDSRLCHPADNVLLGGLEARLPDVAFAEGCSMASGAKCAIASTVLWFVAGVAALRADPEEGVEPTSRGPDGTPLLSEEGGAGEGPV